MPTGCPAPLDSRCLGALHLAPRGIGDGRSDLALPERSGLDVAQSVKSLQPETPVVLITGWGHLLDPLRLREGGVDLMLVKPFRIERMISVVAEALRLRRTG